MNIDPLAFLAEFRAEVIEHLNTLDAQLLQLERDPGAPEPVRAMFLAAHSIKGGAAMLGLTEFLELSHALEDVLSVLRDHRGTLDPGTADVVFRAVDRLRALLPTTDGAPHPSTPETLAIVAELAACATGQIGVQQPTPLQSGLRVLLVEDSPTIRQIETHLLQDAGFVVDTVAGASEAVVRARAMRYGLIIAGIETRELRGPDLVQALRAGASGPTVPVVLTSTDHGVSLPAPIPDVVFAPKGRPGDGDFLRVVRELTVQVAA